MVVALLFTFASLLIVSLIVKQNNDNGISYVHSSAWTQLMISFIFSTIFSAFVVMIIFKEGKESGIDLMTFSKPFRRWEIIISRFLILIFSLFVFQIFSFFISLLSVVGDSYSSIGDKMISSLSISFGGFLIQLIISSIFVLFSIICNKVGMIALGMISAIFIPIFGMVLEITTKGKPNIESFNNSTGVVSIDENNLWTLDDEAFMIYGGSPLVDKNGDGSIYGDDYWNPINTEICDFLTYSKYDTSVYFDLWYQWSGMFNMFRDVDETDRNRIVNLEIEGKWLGDIQVDTIDIGDRNNITEQYILMMPIYGDGADVLDPEKINELASSADILAIAKTWLSTDELESRVDTINEYLDTNSIQLFGEELELNRINSYLIYMVIMNKDVNIPLPSTATIRENADYPFLIQSAYFDGWQLQNNSYLVPSKTEWIDTKWLIMFWLLFMATSYSISIFIYYRRDYK